MSGISVVVVAYNSAEDLAAWVGGIGHDIEVIVVDNASSDQSARIGDASGATVLRRERNEGWTRGSNIGAGAARGEVLVFVNPDAHVTDAAIRELAERVRRSGGSTAVAPRFLDGAGRPQHFYFRFPTPITGAFLYVNTGQRIDALLGRPVVRRMLYGETGEPIERVDYVGAACLAVDARAFHDLHGFDERMWLFFSDADFMRRWRSSGRELTVAWDVAVVHRGQGSVGGLPWRELQVLLQRDYAQYARGAYGPAGRLVTLTALVLFGALLPALAGAVRGDLSALRACPSRLRRVLRT